MIGDLDEIQINELLSKNIVGRIGCQIDRKVYIVPISYAYDGKDIYAHTYLGMKVDAMRQNPDVCFEVDDLKDMGNWQSVIAWGTYEEITEPEQRNAALTLLLNRTLPLVSSSTTHLGATWPFQTDNLESIDGIVFRIKLEMKTGKYEKTAGNFNQRWA